MFRFLIFFTSISEYNFELYESINKIKIIIEKNFNFGETISHYEPRNTWVKILKLQKKLKNI